MSSLPFFQFRSSELPDEEAFERWRALMAPVFTIEANSLLPKRPRGEIISHLLGDIMASQLSFNAQRMARQRALVDATPDHLTFQFYLSGGFVGRIAGQDATLRRGLVVVADMRRELEAHAIPSNTMGLSVPHRLLDGVDLRRPPPVLDPARNRLLGARIVALHRELPSLRADEAAPVTAELLSFLRRLFDPSSTPDVLDGAELDTGVRALAERVIARELGAPRLSPAAIAERVRVSRATLYRAFAPEGVMDRVRTRRLEAVRGALLNPAERRSLTQIAADSGFASLPVLDRNYRGRYGCSPRNTRAETLRHCKSLRSSDPCQFGAWWNGLGTSD